MTLGLYRSQQNLSLKIQDNGSKNIVSPLDVDQQNINTMLLQSMIRQLKGTYEIINFPFPSFHLYFKEKKTSELNFSN